MNLLKFRSWSITSGKNVVFQSKETDQFKLWVESPASCSVILTYNYWAKSDVAFVVVSTLVNCSAALILEFITSSKKTKKKKQKIKNKKYI